MDNKKKAVNAEYLQRMNPGKDAKALVNDFYNKKCRMVGLVFLTGIILSGVLFYKDMADRKISDEGVIEREDYGESSQTIEAIVRNEESDEHLVTVTVRHREYSDKELSELFRQAKIWLSDVMKGNNASLSEVKSDLYFPDKYEEAPIAVSYTVSDWKIVKSTGEIRNEELEEPCKITISATFSYEKKEEIADYEITVLPKSLTESELFEKQISEALENEDEKQKNLKTFTLPKEIAGKYVEFREKQDKRFLYAFFLGLLCCVMLYVGMDDDLRKKYEQRKQKLIFAYPEFVSKLALLIGAGMSLTGAIRRIYVEDKKRKDPLYEELTIFVHNLDNGVLEERAIEDFGRRTGLAQYRKFCALLSVNIKKGSVNLKAVLEEESEAAFEMHQSQIRKLGEEAGTKLLVPMVLMLAVVIAIIMIPAFLTYQVA